MKGLELSKRFFTICAKPILEKRLPIALERCAIGLAGEGSECFGFDDELSLDHDFEPGFCLWISENDYNSFGFELERLYESLAKEFEGFSRQSISPVGGRRHGVIKTADFYSRFLGSPSSPQSLEHWLSIPSEALASAVNGEVFLDNLGEFSKIRASLLKGYPEDVVLKKLAAHLVMMSQSGLYNYERCIKRGENGAAQLAVFKFAEHTTSVIYLLNNVYKPFYKWVYKAMRNLPILSNLEQPIVALTELSNGEIEFAAKKESIEEISALICSQLKALGFCSFDEPNLEKHAFCIQNKIKNSTLRNMHIMDGI